MRCLLILVRRGSTLRCFGLAIAACALTACDTAAPRLDGGMDAGADAAPEVDAGSPDHLGAIRAATCSGAAPEPGQRCPDLVVCATECAGDRACVQGCFDRAAFGPDCERTLTFAECFYERVAPGAACEECAQTLHCLCRFDCPEMPPPDCYECIAMECDIGDCVAGVCL